MTDPSAAVLSSFSSALAELVARTKPAIVSVHSHRLRASGFVWKPGLIVTADEALADEGEVSVKLADGTTLPPASPDAITQPTSRCCDLIPRTLRRPRLHPRSGSRLAVGRGRRRARRSHRGAWYRIVGWRPLAQPARRRDRRQDRTRRAAAHSHEGGLALNAAGEAIGMAVQGVRRILVIPSATIDRVAGRLETHGRIARGYLGVGLQPVKLDDGVGAMVMSVDRSGPSAAAGIRQGDIIVGWNDEKLSGVRSLLRALGPDSVGSVVDVTIRRGGEPVRIKLDDRRKGGCVSEEVAPVVVVAIEISDPALADRLASLLGGVTGIRLATPGEAAAVALVSRRGASRARTCRHRAYAARTRRAGADGRRRIEQGDCETAWNIRSHGQIPRRIAARQARRHRPHRRRGTRCAPRRDPPVTPRARPGGRSCRHLGI